MVMLSTVYKNRNKRVYLSIPTYSLSLLILIGDMVA